jgi:hypothetical protein
MLPRTAIVALAAGLAAFVIPASASATTRSQVFTDTGEHAFLVPAGVTRLDVRLAGGPGGFGYNVFGHVGPGGRGGVATATLAVTPRQALFVEVAGGGANGNAARPGPGGSGGGGAGGGGYAGGGGGASDVRTCSIAHCAAQAGLLSRLLVAGGGGGGGGLEAYWAAPGATGGAAGGAGADGPLSGYGLAAGLGGGPGGHSGGGAAGGTSPVDAPASPGTLGAGGAGGGLDYDGDGGGGGGGGLYGGGGGGGGEHQPHGYGSGSGGGGGGGASGVPAGAAGVSGFAASIAAADVPPSATLTWTLPAPTVATGPAAEVSATAATITGTVDANGSQTTDCHFEIAPTGRSVPCAQQVGSGSDPVGVSAPLPGLAPGTTYSVRLVSANTEGTTAGSPLTFVTGQAQPPQLAGVGQSSRHWREAATRHGHHAKLPVGTRFRFTLDRPAAVQLRFARGGARAVGTLRVDGRPGPNRVRFAGRVSGKRLRPGRYTVTLVAIDASGAASSASVLRFTIAGS